MPPEPRARTPAPEEPEGVGGLEGVVPLGGTYVPVGGTEDKAVSVVWLWPAGVDSVVETAVPVPGAVPMVDVALGGVAYGGLELGRDDSGSGGSKEPVEAGGPDEAGGGGGW